MRSILVTLAVGLASGCQGSGPAAGAAKIPLPRVALVLGGGGARGFAHVGVVRVLEQEKILMIEYVEIADPDSLVFLSRVDRKAVLLVAARLGPIRLIDNFFVM